MSDHFESRLVGVAVGTALAIGATLFMKIGVEIEKGARRPAPVVQVVRLPNGEPVTCIVLEHSVTCDFLGWSANKVVRP